MKQPDQKQSFHLLNDFWDSKVPGILWGFCFKVVQMSQIQIRITQNQKYNSKYPINLKDIVAFLGRWTCRYLKKSIGSEKIF